MASKVAASSSILGHNERALQSRIRGRREVDPLYFPLKGTLIKFDLRTLLLQFTLLIRFEIMVGIVL
jgi:hypothetical protein